MEFSKLPVTPLVGAPTKIFRAITQNREIDKKYRFKYSLTKIISTLVSLIGGIENRRYKKLQQKEYEAPVFILGHWRSGTTFVHNVLCCDKQFGYTTTYQTVFPNVMLFMQPFFKYVMRRVMPKKRPVDGLELNPDLPQEEEFALMGMTPYNYYNFWSFPRHMMEYAERYLLMTKASKEEKADFEEAFKKLVRLSLHNTGGSRYLSKNPPHTARVKELLEIYPDAKFIFLMRNPYTVFESTRSFFSQTIVPLQFQDIEAQELETNFVEVYRMMYDKYQQDKTLIPKGNLIEIKFEDFEGDPIGMTRKIYESLNLPNFEASLPAFEAYAGAKRKHKKNEYAYEENTRKTVESEWARALEDWGYSLQ